MTDSEECWVIRHEGFLFRPRDPERGGGMRATLRLPRLRVRKCLSFDEGNHMVNTLLGGGNVPGHWTAPKRRWVDNVFFRPHLVVQGHVADPLLRFVAVVASRRPETIIDKDSFDAKILDIEIPDPAFGVFPVFELSQIARVQ